MVQDSCEITCSGSGNGSTLSDKMAPEKPTFTVFDRVRSNPFWSYVVFLHRSDLPGSSLSLV